MPTQKDRIKVGQHYHYLTVIGEPYPVKKGRYTHWMVKCSCKCGKKKDIRVATLLKGSTKSCGCYNRVAASQRMAEYNQKYTVDITHPLYHSWVVMKRKCYNQNASDYLGGKYKVCEQWCNNYECFYHWGIQAGWVDGNVLSRKDETKNFTPDNCYFRTKADVIIENQNLDKAKQTCIQRYGVPYYLQTNECKIKTQQTSRQKYGTDFPSQSTIVQDKITATNLQRYGTKYPTQTQAVKDKTAATCMRRYGVKAPSMCQDVKKKQIATTIAKYSEPFYNKISGAQQSQIKDWLSLHGLQFTSDYKILQGKEIDLYNADLQLGIEYCGLHWHHEHSKEPKHRKYHYDKYKQCREAGVRLITIFSDEWLHRQDQVKNFLRSVMGKNQRVYGRKCTVTQIDKQVGKSFLEAHHIQGQKRAAMVYFGLRYDNQLIGIMSLNHHHRQGNNAKRVVLDRLAFADGVSVVGGASKLLKLAQQWSMANGFEQIVSWSDNRWSCGGVYEKMRFVLEQELPPDYSYVKISSPSERISKQQMTKKKIGCPHNMTEHKYALQLGFARIWDCGKKRYIYEANNH